MSDQDASYAGAKFKIINGVIQLSNQSPKPTTKPKPKPTMQDEQTDNEPKPTPALKVAKPMKPKNSPPDKRGKVVTEAIDMSTLKVVKVKAEKTKPASKPKKDGKATAKQSPATAVDVIEAAPAPAPEETDATDEQDTDNETQDSSPKGKRDVQAPFNPMDPNWKPTCKFGTAMKRAKKWYSRWKESKDDEKRVKYFRAASGFAQRAIEKASNEAETLEAKSLSDTINA